MDTRTILLGALCALLSVAAHSQSGFDLSPSLNGIREASPSEYRLIADGTFDSMTASGRVRFVHDLRMETFGFNPEQRAALDARLQERLTGLEDARRGLPPDRLAEFDRHYDSVLLERLRSHNEFLELRKRGSEALPDALDLIREKRTEWMELQKRLNDLEAKTDVGTDAEKEVPDEGNASAWPFVRSPSGPIVPSMRSCYLEQLACVHTAEVMRGDRHDIAERERDRRNRAVDRRLDDS